MIQVYSRGAWEPGLPYCCYFQYIYMWSRRVWCHQNQNPDRKEHTGRQGWLATVMLYHIVMNPEWSDGLPSTQVKGVLTENTKTPFFKNRINI